MIHTYKLFIMSIILSLWTSILWAQDPQKTFILDKQETEAKNYVARESILLKSNTTSGFSFVAGEGKSFSAKVDPGILFFKTDNTYSLPNGNITQIPAEGAVVGSIPSSASVSPSGAATYQIPIEVPSGINGMQPNVSIVYSSQSGFGALGIGWEISGVSAISRTPQSIYYDEVDGEIQSNSIQFNDNDRLSLDGQRLILLNNVGYFNSTAEYGTEIENYSRITMLTSSETGAIYFVLTTKDGKVMEYGKTANSITKNNDVNATNDNRILSWKLSRVTDVYGNYMEYIYSDNGQYISTINYTGTTAKTPIKSVNFTYTENQFNPKLFYIGNFQIQQNKILSTITTKSNQIVLKQYDFAYDAENRLHTITETAQGSEKMNPTTINWGSDDLISSTNIKEVPMGQVADLKFIADYQKESKGFIKMGDVNGDGYQDRIELWLGTDSNNDGYINVYFYDNQNKTFKSTPVTLTFPYSENEKSFKPKLTVSDINADGKDEIIFIYDGWVYQLKYYPPPFGSGEGFLLNDLSFKTEAVYLEKRNFDIISTNVNNDRYNDIVIVYNCVEPTWWNHTVEPGFIVYKGSPYGLKHDTETDVHFFYKYNYNEFSIGDFNADGKIDVLGIAKSGSFDTFYDNELTMVSSPKWGALSNQNEKTKRVTADINNDGLTDIIETYPLNDNSHPFNNRLNIITNNGGFDIDCDSLLMTPYQSNMFDVPTSSGVVKIPDTDLYHVIPMDYNGDGQIDLILGVIATQGNETHLDKNESDWYFYKNVNGNFVLDKNIHWANQAISRGNNVYFMDVNGDDCLDLVVPKGSDYVAFTMLNANKRNLVNSITNGMGLTQSFTYTNYSDYESYNDQGGSVRDLNSPITLVKSFTDTNGDIVNYEFKNGAMHTDGKGFLGFTTIIEKNQLKNSKRTSSYLVDYNYYKMDLYSQIVSTYDDKPISTLSQTCGTKLVDFGRKRFVPVVDYQIATDNLTDITTYTENLTYDANWNVTKSKTTVGNIATTVQIVYKSRIEDGPLYLPGTVTVTKEKGAEKFIRVTEYGYNSYGNLIREAKDSLDKNKSATTLDENKLVTEYKEFDQWGHPTKIEVTANSQTRLSTLKYDFYDGYYNRTKTNHLGEVTTYTWNNDKGVLDFETDHWGHITTYNYNKWGQLQETILPDRKRKVSFLQWALPDNNYDAQYYSYSESSGSAPVWNWYDSKGRKFCEETLGLKGNKISLFVIYEPISGKVSTKYQPTLDLNVGNEAATYTYDEYGRVKTILTPTGTTIYDYSYNGNKKVTLVSTSAAIIEEGNKVSTTETTVNDAGQIIKNKINGKLVTYDYYASGLIKSTTPENGIAITMEYDQQGKRIKLNDPDGGITESKYDGFGNLLWENQKVHKPDQYVKTTNNYNTQTGLLESILSEGKETETTVYTYDTANGHKGRIKTIEIAGKHKQTFSYDGLGHITNTKEEIDGHTYNRGIEYDPIGRVKKEIFPSGYYTLNTYDDYGNLAEVKDKVGREIWKAVDQNAHGQLTKVSRGGKTTDYVYDEYRGFLQSIASGAINMVYDFNGDGTLYSRMDLFDDQHLQGEYFKYDTQKRLINWDIYNDNGLVKPNIIFYNASGNIESKTDLGNFMMNYGEGNGKPHALTTIMGVSPNIPTSDLNVTYTDFKKIATLNEDNKNYTLTYGVDDERIKSEFYKDNILNLTRYYLGDYEEETDALGNVRKIHYLSGGAMMITNNGVESLYYGYSDYQGSLLALTDEAGNVVERYAYDPWGARRNPEDWSQKDLRTSWIINRGYTGHEHLDAFGIINMNGRVYDPYTAMFFSPDPFVQAPENWLNYNRYSYGLNNPLMYSDPSGYNFLGDAFHWLFYTSEGYEFQKIISPVAIHKFETNGNDKKGSGWEVSLGVPNLSPISYRYHYSQVNYENYYDHSFAGKTTVQGGEWSLNGYVFLVPLSITYGSNNYDGGADATMNQKTNYIFIGNPFVNLRFEDDSDDLGLKWVPWMDHASGDKYRTSAMEFNCFGFTAGYKLMTGEDDGSRGEDINGHHYHGEKNVHRLGLLYFGVNGNLVGYNSETIRDILQNKLIHQSRIPEIDSWKVLNISDQGYWNTGSTGGSSLWY